MQVTHSKILYYYERDCSRRFSDLSLGKWVKKGNFDNSNRRMGKESNQEKCHTRCIWSHPVAAIYKEKIKENHLRSQHILNISKITTVRL